MSGGGIQPARNKQILILAKVTTRVLSLVFLFSLAFSCADPINQLKRNFINPPLSLKSRPLWFWNRPLSREQTLKVMKASKEAGYYGLGIVPSYGMTPEFMTPEYLAQYKMAVEIADSLGMKLYLYDTTLWYPIDVRLR